MDLVGRAKAIIMSPAMEWQVIAAEPTDTKSLFTNYAIPMSAIPAVAGFIGAMLFTSMLPVRIPMVPLLIGSVVSYILGLVMLFALGKIIEALAPKFDGASDEVSAMKLAIYAATPAWVAGILAIIPVLGIIALLGALYSLYVFYLGVPTIVRVPKEKAVIFTVVVIVCAIVLGLVVGAIRALVH